MLFSTKREDMASRMPVSVLSLDRLELVTHPGSRHDPSLTMPLGQMQGPQGDGAVRYCSSDAPTGRHCFDATRTRRSPQNTHSLRHSSPRRRAQRLLRRWPNNRHRIRNIPTSMPPAERRASSVGTGGYVRQAGAGRKRRRPIFPL